MLRVLTVPLTPMQSDIQIQIENLLLERQDWVSSKELCSRFGCKDRQLRMQNDSLGLCSGFAISGDAGFKHVALASREEWLHFKHRLRKHGIQELVRVRLLDRKRQVLTREIKTQNLIAEKVSGQLLMADLLPGRYQ